MLKDTPRKNLVSTRLDPLIVIREAYPLDQWVLAVSKELLNSVAEVHDLLISPPVYDGSLRVLLFYLFHQNKSDAHLSAPFPQLIPGDRRDH